LETIRPVWLKFHREWLEKIPHSRHVITHDSSHGVPFEEPELVIKTIREVVDEARTHGSPRTTGQPAKIREIVSRERFP
jgi:hypothetical protein